MRIQRNTYFNPSHNMTTVCGMRMFGHVYDEELAGPDGMHYHVWFDTKPSQDELKAMYRKIAANQDIVSMSWDLLNGEIKP